MTNRYTLAYESAPWPGLYYLLDCGAFPDNQPMVAMSVINNISDKCEIVGGHFYGGVFEGGTYYEGDFFGGTFYGGKYYSGIFYSGDYTDGYYYGATYFGGELPADAHGSMVSYQSEADIT